jgi:hypothetical protein
MPFEPSSTQNTAKTDPNLSFEASLAPTSIATSNATKVTTGENVGDKAAGIIAGVVAGLDHDKDYTPEQRIARCREVWWWCKSRELLQPKVLSDSDKILQKWEQKSTQGEDVSEYKDKDGILSQVWNASITPFWAGRHG